MRAMPPAESSYLQGAVPAGMRHACSLLIAHCSLLIAHCSLLVARCSLLVAHRSSLIARRPSPAAHAAAAGPAGDAAASWAPLPM